MTAEVQIELRQTPEELASLVNSLKERVGLTQISAATVHLVLKEAMELVEELNIPGEQKRDNVIAIVKALVIDLVENEEEEKLILSLIDKQVIENAMSLIILASKGGLNLNNKTDQKKIASFFTTCIPVTLNFIFYIIKACNPKKAKSTTSRDAWIKENTTNKQTESTSKPEVGAGAVPPV